VSLGITAVSLMLAGPYINVFIQNMTQKLHWLLRYLIFILVCTVGYGFLTHFALRSLARWLVYQRNTELLVITAAIYLALAFFAKKQGHI
jgi:hypothetical protein